MKSKNLFLNKCIRLRSSLVLTFVLLQIGALVNPVVSDAAGVAGDSRTYLQARENTDGSRVFGLYEYLDFAAQDLGNEKISFYTGGWLRYDLGEEQYNSETNSELQYGYLSIKGETADAALNVGRVMVFEGVAAERMDGAYARTNLLYNFGVSVFGGVPVETGVDLPGNDLVYGTRVSHEKPGVYQIGVSYLKEEKNSTDFREEQGYDIWVHPIAKVELLGRSSYNAITSEWMNDNFYLSLGPFDKLRLNTNATWISYDDYFAGATTAAFSFKSGALDPKEDARILGQEVIYAASDRTSFSVDYKQYSYEIAGDANYYGGTIRHGYSDSAGSGVSVHRMDGDQERLRYSEYRIYSYRKIDKNDLSLDLIDVVYDRPVNNVKNSFSASLATGYEFSEKWKLGAAVDYSRNPDFDKEVRAFLKAIYRFDVGFGTGKGA